jgi:tight adherence protein C
VSFLVGAIPGLVASLVVLSMLHGYRLLRSDPADGLDLEDLVLLKAGERSRAQGDGPLARLAGKLLPALRRRLPIGWVRWLQRRVDLAGRPQDATVDTVLKQFIIWALIVSPAALMFLSQVNIPALALCVAAVIIMPLARLSRTGRLRRDQLDRDLPDFLDVLAVTVSAGVAFRPALSQVSDRFGGPLAEEFTTALHQIANGASVRGAFIQLRDRNDSESLSEFVTAYLQSDELGAPMVQTLNQIARDMRKASAQRQRRKAAQVAPRVTLVNSLVLVPGTLIILLSGLLLGSGVDIGSLLGGAAK